MMRSFCLLVAAIVLAVAPPRAIAWWQDAQVFGSMIQIIHISSVSTISVGGSTTINAPPLLQNGDFMFLYIADQNTTATPPSGWIFVTSVAVGGEQAQLYYKYANNEPASYTITNTAFPIAIIKAYRNVATSNAINAFSTASGTAGTLDNLTAPTETVVSGEWEVNFWSADGGVYSAPDCMNDVDSGTTQRTWIDGDFSNYSVPPSPTAANNISSEWEGISVTISPTPVPHAMGTFAWSNMPSMMKAVSMDNADYFSGLPPANADIDTFVSQGGTMIRLLFGVLTNNPAGLPISSQVNGVNTLSTSWVNSMAGFINYALTKKASGGKTGIWVALDYHAYAQFWCAASGTMVNLQGGSCTSWGGSATNAFADFWAKMAAAFPQANVVFELMNEPTDGNISDAQWHDIAVAAVKSIRNVETSNGLYSCNPSAINFNGSKCQWIMLQFVPFENAWNASSTIVVDNVWNNYTDYAGGPWMMSIHSYVDNIGNEAQCVAGDPNKSGTILNTSGLTNYLKTQKYYGWIGETGYCLPSFCGGEACNTMQAQQFGIIQTASNPYIGSAWFLWADASSPSNGQGSNFRTQTLDPAESSFYGSTDGAAPCWPVNFNAGNQSGTACWILFFIGVFKKSRR